METHLDLTCPKCRRGLRVRAELGGRRVKCRYCGHAFVVEAEAGPPSVACRHAAGVPDGGPEGDIPCAFGVPGYENLGLIRDGAMGRVYKARQTSVDRLVALKVLQPHLATGPEYVERLRREATLTARLSHPNIPHLIDAGSVGDCPYLVMEYAPGETVLDLISERGAFEEAEAVAVALGVAEALGHAHAHGLVHRDVKPSNVILTPDGGVKLIDFGLARPVADEDWAAAEAGSAIGTPEYISPEQTRGQADVDARSDLYSLGATLYHMATGRVPHAGTSGEVLRRHADPRVNPERADRVNPALSAGLVDVLDALLVKNREGRYRRAADLAADLRSLLRGERPAVAGRTNGAPAPAARRPVPDAGESPETPPTGLTPGVPHPEPGRAKVVRDGGDVWWSLGEFDRAAATYTEAIALNPADAGAYVRRGGARLRLGEYALALADLGEAARLDPDSPAAQNRLAWLLAACPDPRLRDGASAVASATVACERTGWGNAGVLDTLAAARAEAGDFQAALAWQAKALDLLDEGSPDREAYRGRLELYREGRPFRDAAPARQPVRA